MPSLRGRRGTFPCDAFAGSSFSHFVTLLGGLKLRNGICMHSVHTLIDSCAVCGTGVPGASGASAVSSSLSGVLDKPTDAALDECTTSIATTPTNVLCGVKGIAFSRGANNDYDLVGYLCVLAGQGRPCDWMEMKLIQSTPWRAFPKLLRHDTQKRLWRLFLCFPCALQILQAFLQPWIPARPPPRLTWTWIRSAGARTIGAHT